MKNSFIILLTIFSCSSYCKSQDTTEVKNYIEKIGLGIGIGLDFGGIGINMTVYPQKNIGLFGGAGITFIGFGYNLGAKYRIISEYKPQRIVPYALGMYGYNTAIFIKNGGDFNKFFYGPSFGMGIELRPKPEKNREGYWTFHFLIPIRNKEYNDYIVLLNSYNITFEQKINPITFSFGYIKKI